MSWLGDLLDRLLAWASAGNVGKTFVVDANRNPLDWWSPEYRFGIGVGGRREYGMTPEETERWIRDSLAIVEYRLRAGHSFTMRFTKTNTESAFRYSDETPK